MAAEGREGGGKRGRKRLDATLYAEELDVKCSIRVIRMGREKCLGGCKCRSKSNHVAKIIKKENQHTNKKNQTIKEARKEFKYMQ